MAIRLAWGWGSVLVLLLQKQVQEPKGAYSTIRTSVRCGKMSSPARDKLIKLRDELRRKIKKLERQKKNVEAQINELDFKEILEKAKIYR